MTVPIADEDIEQPRREQRPRIDALVGVLVQAREQLFRADDARAGAEAGDVAFIVLFGWTKLEQTERAAKLLAILTKQGVIGKNDEPRRDVKHLRRIEQPSDDEGAGRVLGTDHVVQYVPGVRLTQVRGQAERRILVHGAKDVLASVAAGESQRFGLHRSAALEDAQSARGRVEPEQRHLEWRRP